VKHSWLILRERAYDPSVHLGVWKTTEESISRQPVGDVFANQKFYEYDARIPATHP
jgi:hypothetical protein